MRFIRTGKTNKARKDRPPPGEPGPRMLRNIKLAAHGSLFIFLATWMLLIIKIGGPYGRILELVAGQMVGGRAGSAGVGLQLGFSPYYLLFHICMQDFIIMLYVYPLFVTGYRRMSQWPIIGSTLARTHELALRHKGRIEPYGAMGLMIFVFFPLWSTGPLVGVIVGYLIGLRTWVTFTSVVLGNLVAVGAWVWGYDALRNYDKTLALILLAVLLAAGLLATVVGKMRRARKDRISGPSAVPAPRGTGAATDTAPRPRQHAAPRPAGAVVRPPATGPAPGTPGRPTQAPGRAGAAGSPPSKPAAGPARPPQPSPRQPEPRQRKPE